MTERVCLLSEVAERFHAQPSAPAAKKGFWSGLASFLGTRKDEITVASAGSHFETGEALGVADFVPFAKIGDVFIYIKVSGNHREVALVENDKPWDLTEWQESGAFRSRFLAECYFMVTKDDYQIDEQEAKVLHALFNCLNPSSEEIAEAKAMVYWVLVAYTMEDRVLTEEEMDTMDKVIAALELTKEDLQNLHETAIREKFNELATNVETDPVTEEKIAMIERMAANVGLDPTFIQKEADVARRLIPSPS
jgi:Na+-transporting NADH:ubiquinone oxidoreductase subunit NqrC